MIVDLIKKYRGFQRCLHKEDLDDNFGYDEFVGFDSEYFKNKSINDDKKLKIDEKINFVSGWVPYVKDKTSILIYNFFSTNYSIRKNLILKISVLKNHKVFFKKFIT